MIAQATVKSGSSAALFGTCAFEGCSSWACLSKDFCKKHDSAPSPASIPAPEDTASIQGIFSVEPKAVARSSAVSLMFPASVSSPAPVLKCPGDRKTFYEGFDASMAVCANCFERRKAHKLCSIEGPANPHSKIIHVKSASTATAYPPETPDDPIEISKDDIIFQHYEAMLSSPRSCSPVQPRVGKLIAMYEIRNSQVEGLVV
jgi:hypothetical protein